VNREVLLLSLVTVAKDTVGFGVLFKPPPWSRLYTTRGKLPDQMLLLSIPISHYPTTSSSIISLPLNERTLDCLSTPHEKKEEKINKFGQFSATQGSQLS